MKAFRSSILPALVLGGAVVMGAPTQASADIFLGVQAIPTTITAGEQIELLYQPTYFPQMVAPIVPGFTFLFDSFTFHVVGTVTGEALGSNQPNFTASVSSNVPTFTLLNYNTAGSFVIDYSYSLFGEAQLRWATFDATTGQRILGNDAITFVQESGSGAGSISVTVLAAVPEPSTWVMMIFAFAGVGILTYRRRNQVALA